MNARSKTALLVLCLLAPMTALANAGTPLVWASAFHLLIGNYLIGLGEAWLLDKKFGVERNRAELCMIPANYFSMIFGWLALGFLETGADDSKAVYVALEHWPWFVALGFLAAYASTLLLEWPFVYAALKSQPDRARRSLSASLLVQTCSYVCLAPVYLLTMDFSLATKTEVTPPANFVKSPKAWLYFISPDDGDAFRLRLDGTERSKVVQLGERGAQARLFAWRSDKEKPFDLWVKPEGRTKPRLALPNVGLRVSVWLNDQVLDYINGTWGNAYSEATIQRGTNFAQASSTEWTVAGRIYGLRIIHSQNPDQWLGLDGVPMRNFILLPDDQLVFQLGDQVMLLDLPTRKIGFITMGRGPVVVLDDEPSPEPLNGR